MITKKGVKACKRARCEDTRVTLIECGWLERMEGERYNGFLFN